MTWTTALRKQKAVATSTLGFSRPAIPQHTPDWARLVSLDFETYYDVDYTLSKLSTSEYVRDPRFKAQMVGIKVGNGKTRIIPHAKIKTELAKINWSTHSLLCHNTQFDGFVLSHHYGIHPAFLYDSLSMARGLHSNDIGAGLDEVSVYYGGHGKLEGLEATKGVLNWDKKLFAATAIYCANDVDEMLRVFKLMLPQVPDDEIHLIDLTCRMFCDPVLKVDIPRVEKELERELARREVLMYEAVDPTEHDLNGSLYDKAVHAKLLKGPEKLLEGVPRDMQIIKRIIGSNEMFAALLRTEGVEPPVKISDAWIKKKPEERDKAVELLAEKKGISLKDAEYEIKWTYAFAKDDVAFTELPNQVDNWGFDLNLHSDVALMVAKQERLQALVDVRIAVKSTTNITRAERFLTAGANGMSLPIGYAYYRAHTGRWGGQNKMNMQNLTRGGELRLSILAAKGHQIAVQDSGQIECRVNGWLWGQDDLMDAFRDADRGIGRDAYCNFADHIYGREITKADKVERFVGKVCVLGLGFQMGAPKLQTTFAKGALGGPPVYFELDKCKMIVNTYRNKNYKIQAGWKICERIIEDMAAGRTGGYGPLNWEANTIWLPNGMALKYPDLRKATGEKGWDEWSYQGGKMRKKIYGGLLCENIVQALARIIVAWQMLQISRKYRVVMTTHDEVVAMPKTAQAKACLAFMAKWMSTAPAWCSDIPLNCEGGFDVNYSK
jgi:DNA polymerase